MTNTEQIDRLRSYKNISFIGGCVFGAFFLSIALNLFSAVSDVTSMIGGYGEQLNVLPLMVLMMAGICFLFAFTSRFIFDYLLTLNTNQIINEDKKDTIDQLKI